MYLSFFVYIIPMAPEQLRYLEPTRREVKVKGVGWLMMLTDVGRVMGGWE